MKTKNTYSGLLRQKAEEQHKNKSTGKSGSRTEADTRRLLYELEVHQIELEMQNQELIESEEKSRQANEKFTSLYDFAPMGYFTLGPDCRIHGLNLSGARMAGIERFLLQNVDFRNYVARESLNSFNEFIHKIFENDTKQVCKVKLIRDDNSSMFVHIEGVLSIEDQSCSLTVLDISERESAEVKLRNSEMRYRRLFETSQTGILIFDIHTGRVVDVNPYLIKLLGFSYEVLLEKQLCEIGLFKDMEDTRKFFSNLRLNDFIQFEDKQLKNVEGRLINVEVIINSYQVDQENVFQFNIRDITLRKRAEDKLKENEIRLSELNATKDKFFSIIAHDLKSPFTSIIGFSSLILEMVHKKNYKELEKYAQIIESSSWKAMNLLTNLMEWSRSQTGKLAFNPENLDLCKLVNIVTDLLNDAASQKSITITNNIPQKFMVYADISLLSTIMRNLISNGLKFTDKGGKIEIYGVRTASESVISFTDNGIGISKENIAKLFRIDANHSTTGTHGEEGTGLGLLLCNDFVEKHGGKMRVESEEHKGSTFSFTLINKD
jgi:two-component system, sensor histidine kinase and response regulator